MLRICYGLKCGYVLTGLGLVCVDWQLLRESVTQVPEAQKMERQRTLAKERRNDRRAALERAVTLKVPYAFSPEELNDDEESDASSIVVDGQGNSTAPEHAESSGGERNGDAAIVSNWNDLVDRLFSTSTDGEQGNLGQGETSGREGSGASGKASSVWNGFVGRLFSKSKSGQNTRDEKKKPLLS